MIAKHKEVEKRVRRRRRMIAKHKPSQAQGGGQFYNFTLQHLLGRNAAKESIIAIHVHPGHIDLVDFDYMYKFVYKSNKMKDFPGQSFF